MSENFTGEKFTRIPNGYLEGKARYRNLNQEEGCVLMVLERETFGFGRAWAKLSLGYLEEKTGMSKPNLHRALKNLIRKNLILQSDKEVSEYGVQTDPARWEKISSLSHGTKKVIPSDNEEPLSREIKTIIPSDNKVLSHRITLNRNNKETRKETSKETQSPASRRGSFSSSTGEKNRSSSPADEAHASPAVLPGSSPPPDEEDLSGLSEEMKQWYRDFPAWTAIGRCLRNGDY